MAEINVNVTANPPTVIQTNVTVQPPTQPVVNVSVPQNSSPVLAVNGYIGYVTLGASDVGLANVGNYSITGTSGVLQSAINSTNNSILSLSGVLTGNYVLISTFTGSGIAVQSQISGLTSNLALTGANLSNYLLLTGSGLAANLNLTGQNLSTKISSLSGTLISNEGIISSNLASTGATLQSEINSLSGNLISSGSNLSSSISSLSGTLTSTYATISNVNSSVNTLTTNLGTTGSTLSSYISSLSGTLTSVYATYSQLTGLSGYEANVTNLLATYAQLTGYSGFEVTVQNAFATYSQLTGLSGYDATVTNLATTGSTLANSINALSGTLSNYALNSSLSSYYPSSNPSGFITGINTSNFITTSQTGLFYPNSNPSGFITGLNTGNFVTTSSAAFIVRPTVNGTGVLLSGEASAVVLPSGLVYTTGTQNISGSKLFYNTILSSGIGTVTSDPFSVYTSNTEQMRIFANGNVAYNDFTNMPGAASNNAYKVMHYASNSVGGSTMLSMASRNTNTAFFGNLNGAFVVGLEGTNYPIYFKNGLGYANSDTLGGGNTRMIILGNGNVGIANSNPQYNLDVTGSGNFTSGLYVNGQSVITAQQTNLFYAASNPSGFITGVNLSAYTLNANTGSFITTSQTGSFYPNSNPSGFISVNKANLNAIAYAIALG